jgi:hypothetical protein
VAFRDKAVGGVQGRRPVHREEASRILLAFDFDFPAECQFEHDMRLAAVDEARLDGETADLGFYGLHQHRRNRTLSIALNCVSIPLQLVAIPFNSRLIDVDCIADVELVSLALSDVHVVASPGVLKARPFWSLKVIMFWMDADVVFLTARKS